MVRHAQIPPNILLMKTSFVFVFRRRLDQDRHIIRLHHTSSRRLGQDEYICLGHMSSRRLQDVSSMSSRRLAKTSSRHFQDVLFLYRYLEDVFKTRNKVKLFLWTSLRDVFSTFLRRTAKTVVYRRICLRFAYTSEIFIVSVQSLQER